MSSPGRAPAKVHDLYARSAENRRWAGPLAELPAALRREAFEREGGWAWRVLPKGAVVSMRIRGDMDMRKEVRVSRGERPETNEATDRWENEVRTFIDHLGLDGWHRLRPQPEDDAKGGIATRFLELREGEVSPGKALCHRCLKAGVATVVPWDGERITYCNPHKFEAGREYTEEVLRRTRGVT